ncbi:MAG: CPBP family intramembrane metalloprotease, partial [Oscillospiraceae bacterium]|nr:CPBP family intramembrane metalloprotease [Oscillospiraceae bacterium]
MFLFSLFGKPFGGKKHPWRAAVCLFFAGTALCLAGSALASLPGMVAGWQAPLPDPTRPASVGNAALALLTGAIVPALWEEFVFRGAAMLLARRIKMPAWLAVLLTAALFAALHRNPALLPATLVSGVALGWVALRGGSLWPTIAVHMWNNAAGLLFAWLGATQWLR